MPVWEQMFERLVESMTLLVDACGYQALKPYKNGVFAGRVGRTSIEIILVGIVKSLDNIKSKTAPLDFVKKQVTEFWASDNSKRFSAAGIAGTDRVQFTIPLGVSLFSR